MADPWYITIVSAQPAITVTALRGLEPPVPAGGYGGWDQVDRPRRKSLTEWGGIAPQREIVPLLLDGVADDRSIEGACRRLERMAQPAAAGAEPPIVRVLGAVPHPAITWVIEDLEWDSGPLYSPTAGGYRIRQAVKVHLLEYVADDRLATAPAAERARRAAVTKTTTAARSTTAKAASAPKSYVVRQGDTLAAIAARVLGSYKRYREIADLNDIRDPNRITVGQRLTLP